jgi:putative PIN family toxin of toxin-antitoxin system
VKVFLDTNVLASAFATRGLCADVLQATLAGHDRMVAEVVLVELKRVLREKFHVPADVIKETEAFLRQFTVVPKPKKHLDLGIRDPDDEWVVASAVAGDADVIVTGDKDLTTVKKAPVDILTPREFWERLARGRD